MLRTLACTAVLAATSMVSAASGTAAAPSVTISASRPSVVYGGSLTLSGRISDSTAGQTVDVLAKAFDSASFGKVASATTTADGRWTQDVKPSTETSYEASWMSATSSIVTVKVRPMITLALVSRANRTFSTKVTAARSFAGKFVLVQRLSSTGVATLKKVTLDANSSASFRVRLHRGRSRLRVVMPSSQTAPGYITGTSNVLTVRV